MRNYTLGRCTVVTAASRTDTLNLDILSRLLLLDWVAREDIYFERRVEGLIETELSRVVALLWGYCFGVPLVGVDLLRLNQSVE